MHFPPVTPRLRKVQSLSSAHRPPPAPTLQRSPGSKEPEGRGVRMASPTFDPAATWALPAQTCIPSPITPVSPAPLTKLFTVLAGDALKAGTLALGSIGGNNAHAAPAAPVVPAVVRGDTASAPGTIGARSPCTQPATQPAKQVVSGTPRGGEPTKGHAAACTQAPGARKGHDAVSRAHLWSRTADTCSLIHTRRCG
jgi:hypothetical protein